MAKEIKPWTELMPTRRLQVLLNSPADVAVVLKLNTTKKCYALLSKAVKTSGPVL